MNDNTTPSPIERLELLQKQSAALETARNVGLDVTVAEELFTHNVTALVTELGHENLFELERDIDQKMTAIDGLLNSGLFDESTTQMQRDSLSQTPEARLLSIARQAGLISVLSDVEVELTDHSSSDVVTTADDNESITSHEEPVVAARPATSEDITPESRSSQRLIHVQFSGEGLERELLLSRNPGTKARNRKSAIPLINEQSITRAESPEMTILTREYTLGLLLKGETFRGLDIMADLKQHLIDSGIQNSLVEKLNFTSVAGRWLLGIRYNNQPVVVNTAGEKSFPQYAINPKLNIAFEGNQPDVATSPATEHHSTDATVDLDTDSTATDDQIEATSESQESSIDTLKEDIRYYTGLIVGAIEARSGLLEALSVPLLDSETIQAINHYLEEKGQDFSRHTPEGLLQERRKAIRTFMAAYSDESIFNEVIDAMDGPLEDFAAYLLDEFSDEDQWEKLIHYLSCEVKTQSKNIPGGRRELTIYKVRSEDITGDVLGNYYEIAQYGQYRQGLVERGFTTTNGTIPILPTNDELYQDSTEEAPTKLIADKEDSAGVSRESSDEPKQQNRQGFVLKNAEIIPVPVPTTEKDTSSTVSESKAARNKRPEWLIKAGSDAKDYLDKIIEKAQQLGYDQPEKLLASEGLTSQQVLRLIHDNTRSAAKTLHAAIKAGIVKMPDDFDKQETPIELTDVLMLSSMKGRKPGKGITNAKQLKNLRRYIETQIVEPFLNAHRN